jgi:hypothetical protein
MTPENYTDIRRKAKSGDVIFLSVDRKNLLSRITSKFTGSPLTHAAILFWMRMGSKRRLMLIESTTNGGIRIVQASIYENRPMFFIRTGADWKELQNRAFENLGKVKYGWFSAIHIGIRDWLFKKYGIVLPSKINRNPACSEFVAHVLNLTDTDIPPYRLYDILKESEKQNASNN